MDILKSKARISILKRRFGPMDLNSMYFIKFEGRFRMDIGSNFEWIGVNWTRNIFQIF
jgi:hypothetical protein